MSDPVANERRRVLEILESHQDSIGEHLYVRLTNLIRSGFDFREEMKLPVEERALGFHWPDSGKPRKPKSGPKKKRRKQGPK